MERDFYKLVYLRYREMYDELRAASQGLIDLVKKQTNRIRLLDDENNKLRDELARVNTEFQDLMLAYKALLDSQQHLVRSLE